MGVIHDGLTTISQVTGVYDGDWDAATTFDLSNSPAVGTAQKLVALKVSSSVDEYLVARPLGSTVDYFPSNWQGPKGICAAAPKQNDHALIITYTNTSGKVELISTYGNQVNVTVMCAAEVNVLGSPEAVLTAAAAPTTWGTDFTISALSGVEGLCLVKVVKGGTAVSTLLSARPSDSTIDTYSTYLGAMRLTATAVGDTCLLLLPTSAVSKFQLRASNGAGYTWDVTVIATIPDWIRNRSTVYGPTAPAAGSTWYDLASIGNGDGLSLLLTTITSGTARIIAFRSETDTGVYVDPSTNFLYSLGAAVARAGNAGNASAYAWTPSEKGISKFASQYNGSTIRVDAIGYVAEEFVPKQSGVTINGRTLFDVTAFPDFDAPTGSLALGEGFLYLKTKDTLAGWSMVISRATRGTFAGGSTGSNTNVIDYVVLGIDGNATDFGNLTSTKSGMSLEGCGSQTLGLFGGGSSGSVIDYIKFHTAGNARNFGNLSANRTELSGLASQTRGVFGGGLAGSEVNIVEYVTFPIHSTATDFGDLILGRQLLTSCSSPTRGVFAGGKVSTSYKNTIDYVTIATTGNATTFGTLLPTNFSSFAGISSPTRGVFGGGSYPTYTNVINYITLATTGNTTDFGNLLSSTASITGVSSHTKGIFAGGTSAPSYTRTNVISKITLATTGNASDFGDLTLARSHLSGCSNGHGGL